MKKFLSLVLALVMTMSLVTVSAGAKDFTDDEKINYEEAVAVMSEVKVLDGYTDGSFKPQAELTRGAAAKIICNMILGPTTASELHADTAPYKDVPVDHTFAGYIAYCAKEGIISGYADGTFRPAAPLTGYAFMKMLLGALGYDQNTEGFTGSNWSINVAKRALGIGLNAGLKTEFSGIKSVTREEAALYAFNTLKATMVEYDEQSTIVVGDATVTLAGKAQDLAWGTGTLNDGKVVKDGFVQFAEKYFPKLVRTDDIDAFGRPSNKWSYDKKDIGSFVDYTKLVSEYTVKVEGGDVYTDIGSVAADFDLSYWQDGVEMSRSDAKDQAAKIAKKNDEKMGATGKGVLTQVFVDRDAEELTIVEINTYLAVTDDYNEKKETLKLDLYGYGDVKTLTLEEFPEIKNYEDGDLVLVTVAKDEIQSITDPESVKGVEITEFSKKDYVVADEKYSYAKTGALTGSLGAALLDNYDKNNLDDVTFNLYFDTYGYLIGIEQVTEDVEYVFITAIDVNLSYLTNKTAEANAIFSDGTPDVIKVDMAKSDFGFDQGARYDNNLVGGTPVLNAWFTYTEKNGVYTVKFAENQIWDTDIEKIDSKHVSQKDTSEEYSDGDLYYYGNADTNYIVAKLGKWTPGNLAVITGVDSVTTGVKNVSLDMYTEAEVIAEAGYKTGDNATATAIGAYSVYKPGTAYIIASIVIGDDGSVSDRYAYLYGTPKNEKYNKSEDVYTWDMKAVIDGAETTVTFKTTLPADDKFAEGLYKLSYDKDGYAVDATLATNPADYDWLYQFDPSNTKILKNDAAKGALNLTCKGDTLWISQQTQMRGYALADECPAVIIEQNDDHEAKKIVEYTTVEKAIKALDNADLNPNFDGTIFIFFKDGVATSVIITDTVTSTTNKNEVNGVTAQLKVSSDGKGLALQVTGTKEGDEVSFKVIAKDIRSGNEGVVNSGEITEEWTKVLAETDGTMTYIVELTVNKDVIKVTL